jgi:hypothetical protein
MRLVPIQDMTTVMTVVSKKKMGKIGFVAWEGMIFIYSVTMYS